MNQRTRPADPGDITDNIGAATLDHATERAAILAFLRAEEARYDKGSVQAIGVDVREACRNKASVLRAAIERIGRGDHVPPVERTSKQAPIALSRADILAAAQEAWDKRECGNPVTVIEIILRRLGMAEHLVTVNHRTTLVGALERTPEVVLRAMLASYERAALEAARAYYRSDDPSLSVDQALLGKHKAVCELVNDVRMGLAEHLEDGAPMLNYDSTSADYEARLAGTRPLDAPPLEDP